MNKVICDVCGADYPDTAKKCPVCGCVQTGAAQTAAGNMARREAPTHTRGGHFSKSNVKKRMKYGAAAQQAAQQSRSQQPRRDDNRFNDDEMESASNRGLIIIVIVLLLAIIAVSLYIAISFMPKDEGKAPDAPQPSASAPITDPSVTEPSVSEPSVDPSQPSTEPSAPRVPCLGLTLQADGGIPVSEITFSAMNSYQRIFAVTEPANCTDQVMFETMNPNVVTVDALGYITAVGNGNTFIQVRCGDQVMRILVKCNFTEPPVDPSRPTDPSNPTQPSEPSQPTDPTQPAKKLLLNRSDFSLFSVGESWNVHRGCEIPASDITWSSSDENVAKVTNGKVVAVGRGKATIKAEYNGQVVTCVVYCQIKATPTEPSESVKPTEPSEPSQPGEPSEQPSEPSEQPSEPSEPTDKVLKLNRDDFSLFHVGESWNVHRGCEIPASEITWSSDNESVATVVNGKVVAVGSGSTIIRAEYNGQIYTCAVHCQF